MYNCLQPSTSAINDKAGGSLMGDDGFGGSGGGDDFGGGDAGGELFESGGLFDEPAPAIDASRDAIVSWGHLATWW